ncbi:putative polyvalent protein kinase domain-containing protein [Capnocytophaga cynodegmi]|uniref:putative polyvalent protein kinase domain-containing protein n=1 Tax=Capnocytophaga cynodegmi TaxID=28189 RepID=UPI001AC8FF2A|nr:hypothetical protein [Capnocytophaga cynodegmi]GIM53884.1 hypothetical protein CAPN005_05310 [Capnocytophaga cynodegmi]
MIKNELQNILSGKGKVKYGEPIQTIACYLRRSSETSTMVERKEQNKSKETEKLCQWIEENNFWIHTIDIDKFISQGAEQKVYLHQDEYVIKLNDGIYYLSWLDYFYNLLLNNYFFPDTAYKLLGFYKDKNVLYAVVQQKFVKANELTSLENVREFMANNGFQLIRNNDYKNQELGIILEDLHDENVLTVDGVLAFIDTVFYLEDSFWE